jgi:hypothetical protein
MVVDREEEVVDLPSTKDLRSGGAHYSSIGCLSISSRLNLKRHLCFESNFLSGGEKIESISKVLPIA